MKKINTVNFESYAEKGKFIPTDNLDYYRQQQLDNQKERVSFIQKLFPKRKINAIDIGSGYSSLLFALEQNKILKKGIAVEQSSASFEFASKWKEDWNFKHVVNVQANALDVYFQKEDADLFLIVDGTFPLLYHEHKSYPEKILKTAYSSLKKRSYILLDMVNFYPLVHGSGKYNTWREFPDSDIFKYGLYERTYNPETNLVECISVFIGKDSLINKKREIAYYYTLENLKPLLTNAGFIIKNVYSDFSYSPFGITVAPRLILVAERQ